MKPLLIKILPESIANKIAAGEIVERPASIVKELVENSLDAGAKSIEVEIRHGGKSLIRIADDGSGMGPEDVELAFQRYATSKISSADDLHRIASFGFRGEALPSIAAVSRVKIQTRTAKQQTGTELSIEGGSLSGAKEAACRPGTVIEVRDLFFNTPARRKFLKGDATEAGHILELVSNLSLSRLDVRFVLKSADKTLLDLLPGQTLEARAAAIFGDDVAKDMLSIEGQNGVLKVRGLIGKPSLARANRTGQVFFINGRLVRSFALGHSVMAGYHGLLMHGQFPVAVLLLDLDLERVDVNVHPTKQEVRISNESEIKTFLKEIVTQRLADTPDLAPQLKMPSTAAPFITERPSIPYASLPQFSFAPRPEVTAPSQNSFTVSEPPAATYSVQEAPALASPITVKDKLRITKVLGQIHHTFIIAETEEGMIVIDQHAAHERVMFEVLVKEMESEKPSSQRLLMEEIFKVPSKQRQLLEGSIETLLSLGFEIEEFGEHDFVIRAVPAALAEENPAVLIKTFLEELEDEKVRTDLENHQEEIAALIACKRRSVKAYEGLSPIQLRSLLERLAVCDNPFACPHGRPTFFKQTFSDLERQFKRK